MKAAAQARDDSRRGALPALLCLLLLTAATLLLWGHVRPLDQDEVFVLQTDGVQSLRALLAVQRHTPISLDPLFYHLLGHGAVALLGPTAFAVRLPSLLGYLLMQVCLYMIGRRMAGTMAGWLAAAVPAITATLFYGVQARPYGVLLGLAALLLWSWLRATRNRGEPRPGPLVLLAVSLALALNTHYFAILLLIPLYGAELVRTVAQSRRAGRLQVDWPVVLAVVAGTAGEVLALPFQKAAAEFRAHYYNAGTVGWHAVTQSYRALLVNYTDYPLAIQRGVGVLLLAGALVLAVALVRLFRQGGDGLSVGERTYLLLLAALPFAGFLLARFVTHSIEVRYVLPAIIAVALLLALAVRGVAGRHPVASFAVILLLIVAAGGERVREEVRRRAAAVATASISPEVEAWLQAHPEGRLFVQNTGHFEEALPLISDALLKQRATLLYSSREELALLGHDTGALTAMHLRAFSQVPVETYEALRQRRGATLFVLYPASGWDWLPQALSSLSVPRHTIGNALGGTAVEMALPLPAAGAVRTQP